MSTFGRITLTNRGRILQSKAQTGIPLSYTRMAVGDGFLGSTSILELNRLVNEVLSLPISSFKVIGAGRASISAILSNQNLTSGFYYREIGIFATDPDVGEILYCYGNAGNLADYIPSKGSDIIEKTLEVQTLVGNATSVSAVIDSSLVWETVEGSIEKTNKAEKNANDYTDSKFKQVQYPVESVNGKTGAVILNSDDVGAAKKEVFSQHLDDDARHNSYSTSSTAAATTAKVATRSGFILATGVHIAVKFTNANTAANPSLNVNNTGAKPIYQSGTVGASWSAGEVVEFVYDGTNWCALGYTKPSAGIPKFDMTTEVQTALDKAVSALQSSSDAHIINPLSATAFSPEYPQGHSVMFIAAGTEQYTGWMSAMGVSTANSHYMIIETFKTNSNNGYQKITVYRLAANSIVQVYIRNSLGSTSWNKFDRLATSDMLNSQMVNYIDSKSPSDHSSLYPTGLSMQYVVPSDSNFVSWATIVDGILGTAYATTSNSVMIVVETAKYQGDKGASQKVTVISNFTSNSGTVLCIIERGSSAYGTTGPWGPWKKISTEDDIKAHQDDPMPHRFNDGTTTYKYGFKLNTAKDGLIFVYEGV